MAGLAAEGISFAYGTSEVLDDVSARVADGGLVGILGPNGSGKTTLLRMLAGLLRPSSGRIVLDGVDLHAIPRATIARRMAVVPQETQLAFDYTVLEMATMGRYPHLGAFEVEGPEDLAIAREALGATGTAASRVAALQHACRAVKSSGWSLRAPSRRIPTSCCSTNRQRRWTSHISSKSARSFRSSTASAA